MNSQCKTEVISDQLQRYCVRPVTKIYDKQVSGSTHRGLFPYVINLHNEVGFDTCAVYCKTNLEHDFAVNNTSWDTINVFAQSVYDCETVADHFQDNVRYVKGPLNEFHKNCLEDPNIIICEKSGRYFGEYDCKLELYNWPFSWRNQGKTDQTLEFLEENCQEFKVVSYLWGISVYMKHQEFSAIQAFLSMCLGDVDFQRSHRVTVRIIN
jgi:hypothetical protein